jgi:hypothetical protein
MDVVEEWKKQLLGTSEVDDWSEFIDLIPQDATDEYLRDIFRPIRNNRTLVERIIALISENQTGGMYIIPKKENYLRENQIRNLAQRYKDNVVRYLSGTGRKEIVSEIENNNFEIVYENDRFLEMAADPQLGLSEAENEIAFDFSQRFRLVGDWMYVLKEAVLHLTKYPVVTRYILEDVVEFSMTGRPYYELWRGGGDICFMKGRSLLLCEAARE